MNKRFKQCRCFISSYVHCTWDLIRSIRLLISKTILRTICQPNIVPKINLLCYKWPIYQWYLIKTYLFFSTELIRHWVCVYLSLFVHKFVHICQTHLSNWKFLPNSIRIKIPHKLFLSNVIYYPQHKKYLLLSTLFIILNWISRAFKIICSH